MNENTRIFKLASQIISAKPRSRKTPTTCREIKPELIYKYQHAENFRIANQEGDKN